MTGGPAYLDWNATAPVLPEARAAMAAALTLTGNASAVHGFGRAARKLIEEAREAVAALAGGRPAEVVFTSGGTEANSLAVRGLADRGAIQRIVLSAIEHGSVREAAEATGLTILVAPVTPDGVVDVDALAARIGPDGRQTLVCVMSANNETGVIQPIAEIVGLAHEAGALCHVDAVQSAGRMALSFAALGADLMTLSAHKLGGPQGAGALLVRQGLELAPLIPGGQERRRRGGTENVAGIAGFGAAAAKAPEQRAVSGRIEKLRDRLERAVLGLAPDAEFFGARAARLPNTSNFAVPGLPAELQVIALDLVGVAVSAGAACSSGKVARSHVLDAMGAGDLAGEAIRVSLGWDTREADIDLFCEAYGTLLQRSRKPLRAANG